jgi:hypothetical protein
VFELKLKIGYPGEKLYFKILLDIYLSIKPVSGSLFLKDVLEG